MALGAPKPHQSQRASPGQEGTSALVSVMRSLASHRSSPAGTQKLVGALWGQESQESS